jgi:hypothetical protein
MKDRHNFKKVKVNEIVVPDEPVPVESKNVLREVICNMLGVKPDCSDDELLKASKEKNNGKTDHSKG